MLQFGGHHLAINLTMAGASRAWRRAFLLLSQRLFTLEGRTIRPLGTRTTRRFALINALNDAAAQAGGPRRHRHRSGARAAAGRQDDSARGHSRVGSRRPAADDARGSRAEWVGIMNDTSPGRRWRRSGRTFRETYFAWSGPTTNGSAVYFRVQGPTVVIEYAPQGGVDHIHTIYRDPSPTTVRSSRKSGVAWALAVTRQSLARRAVGASAGRGPPGPRLGIDRLSCSRARPGRRGSRLLVAIDLGHRLQPRWRAVA